MDLVEVNRYMRLAIEEGRKAIPVCGDNPPVGCVLARDGQVVATGFTNSPGKPHAEAMALGRLAGSAEDVVAFVTLEPCSFNGRTPSCAHALITSGIKTVYVGILDPDARNNGEGIRRMKAAGIHVHVGILAEEISAELAGFLCNAP